MTKIWEMDLNFYSVWPEMSETKNSIAQTIIGSEVFLQPYIRDFILQMEKLQPSVILSMVIKINAVKINAYDE